MDQVVPIPVVERTPTTIMHRPPIHVLNFLHNYPQDLHVRVIPEVQNKLKFIINYPKYPKHI